jgi:hypothetical protein
LHLWGITTEHSSLLWLLELGGIFLVRKRVGDLLTWMLHGKGRLHVQRILHQLLLHSFAKVVMLCIMRRVRVLLDCLLS